VNAPVRFIANKVQAGDDAEYVEKSLDVRIDNHLDLAETAVFLEVAVTDASEFSTRVEVTAARIGTHRVLRATGPSAPNVLAAVLLAVSDKDDMPSHIYFEWSERAPGQNALRFLFAGEGDVPPLTHEILRRASPTPRSVRWCTSAADPAVSEPIESARSTNPESTRHAAHADHHTQRPHRAGPFGLHQ